MKHSSVLKLNSPIEFIESTKISPFISKVMIKVCYVGEEPNRNRSVITKEVATEMGPSLRGCPIVGFYNSSKKDFEEHNRQINISGGEWTITDTTKPYGFVDLNAKIWFATYIDDEQNEHEYLCTEGYIWDHAYPEAKRITQQGNNQSMELDEDSMDALWTEDENENPQFFIINEALISKLCILGEDNEPCFEGSTISSFSLKIDESFQEKMYSMMNEITELLKKEGGMKVFETYAVEIGDNLWRTLYQFLRTKYPDPNDSYCSVCGIEGIYEEADTHQKFAVIFNRDENKYYRVNIAISEEAGITLDENLTQVEKTYVPVGQFAAEAVEAYIAQLKEEDSVATEEPEAETTEEVTATESEVQYNLDEIPEYQAALQNIEELKNSIAEFSAAAEQASQTIEEYAAEIKELREFKQAVERKEKEELINSFYMLSDDDKKDVIENIDSYSRDDIEAKLSIICVRNKVSFAENETSGTTTFNLNEDNDDSSATPAWIKAVLDVAKTMNN